MIDAYAAAAVRSAEEPLLAQERGFAGGLMHRAATALAGEVRAELLARRGAVAGGSVVALVGPGNNGGDALHALAALAGRGVEAVAVALGPAHEEGVRALLEAGGRVLALAPDAPGTPAWLGDAVAAAFSADVLLDGLLGIGATGGLREPAARLVGLLGALLDEGGPGGPVVVAVDVPSGIGVDDGTVPGPVLAADRTVTFGVPKPGLLLPPAARLAGHVSVVDLGLEAVLAEQGAVPVVRRLTDDDLAASWPVPAPAAHKYMQGVVGVLAGSTAYPGAAVLAVHGALATGCGMVRYSGPQPVAAAVLAAHPEVVLAAGRVQAWVVGPGVADDRLPRAREQVQAALREGVPVVVDAGALTVLPEWASGAVLVPHAGELAALLSTRGIARVDRADVEAEPLRWARAASLATGATVLLKGPVTVVVDGVDGDAWSQDDGTPWLATAGAGDVLAGVLGALLARLAADGPVPPAAAARAAAAAASVHGRAAVAASGGGPLTASRVAAAVPGVVAGLLG